ncbi:Radical SAM superfamily protein [Phycisphaerae bacterium RAS1]|nr:Radical SAM superfamily protein [Phycisphaerae bacterium RAS1]
MARAQHRSRSIPYLPAAMRVPPALAVDAVAPRPTRRLALLLNPFYPKDPHASFGKHVLTPTLALTSIAAATPPEWRVRYWDENLLQGPPPLRPFPQVVGISVHLTFARRACELADWYRRRGAIVIMGGLHVLSCPDELAPHADALVVNEETQVWGQILGDVEAGRLKPRYEGAYRRAYRDAPAPRRDILPRDGFLTNASLIATRGCHNRCGFCYLATDGLHAPYQTRDPQQIVDEFLATGEPYGVFVDNNLGSKPDYLRKLCAALRPIGRIWSAAVTIDVTDDPTLVRDMAAAGCTGVFVGFESLAAQNLDDAGKRTPRPEDYARRVAILHRYGIQVNASFVFGFDHDRADVFDRTLRWVEANRIECATYHILTPYPGTPLFAQLESEGRLLHRDWDLYDTAHAVFRPRHMSPARLEAGYDWCYRQTFTLGSIWRRRPALRSQVLPYLAMSLLYKRCNWLWPLLIRHRLTHAVWRPLVEASRRRHAAARARSHSAAESRAAKIASLPPVYAGV